jgi:hypothetical protein
MYEDARVGVTVTDARPQSDGSADCRVFIRLHPDPESLAGPWSEVYVSVVGASTKPLSDVEAHAVEVAWAVLARIVQNGKDGLLSAWIKSKEEDLAERSES